MVGRSMRDAVVDRRWRLVQVLGEGSFGEVWRASDVRLPGRFAAIKFLKPEHVSNPAVLARFENEATALALLDHQHVVRVLDRGEWQGAHFLAMEYVEGETMRAWLDRCTAAAAAAGSTPGTPTDTVALLFDQICSGVGAAHRLRSPGAIVHRDLKPENVIIAGDHDGRPIAKVLDFGIAQLGTRKATQTGMLMGTPLYMAPEQVLGTVRQVGPWTDVFALGVMLAEALEGAAEAEPAVTWAAFALTGAESPRARLGAARRRDVAPAVWDVIAAALQRDPAARPADALVLRDALRRAWQAGAYPSAAPPAPGPPPPPHSTPPPPLVPTRASATAAVLTRTEIAPQPFAPRAAPAPARRSLLESMWAGRSLRSRLVIGGSVLVAGTVLGVAAWRVIGAADPSPSPSPPPRTAAAGSGPALPAAGPPCPDTMRLVEGGVFDMGAADGAEDEGVIRGVNVTSFCIDAREVTAERYGACVAEGKCAARADVFWSDVAAADHALFDPLCTGRPDGPGEHPINCVSWNDAAAYCASAGGELPTEAQWEFAARSRGTRRYAWAGDTAPTAGLANVCGAECRDRSARLGVRPPWPAMFPAPDDAAATAPVGAFARDRTDQGVFDMAGNVREWTRDPYASRYDPRAGEVADAPFRVTRGASWLSNDTGELRASRRRRSRATIREADLGFRCVRTPAR